MTNRPTTRRILQALGLAALLGGLAAFPVTADTQAPQTAYQIDATGQTAALDALDTTLRANPAFKESGCSSLATSLKGEASYADYVCSNPGAATDALFRGAVGEGTTLTTTTAGCPTGCVLTYCPYPTIRCCNLITHQPC
jgi:hypothetical protein